MTNRQRLRWHQDQGPRQRPTVKSVPPVSGQAEALYAEHPGLVTPFASPHMLQTLATMFQRSLLSLGAYCDSHIQGVAQWPIEWKGPVGIAQRLPVRYTGLIAEPENIPASIGALQTALAKRRVGRAYYSFSPQYQLDIDELQHQFCEVGLAAEIRKDFEPVPDRSTTRSDPSVILVPNVTCILDIAGTSEAEIIDSVAQARARTSVRHTLPYLSGRDSTRHDVALHLPHLLRSTYGRRGMDVPYPAGAFEIFWQRHSADPNVVMRTLTLTSSDLPVGMAIGVVQSGVVYSLVLARDYTLGTSLNVAARLITDMAAQAKAMSCSYYDLGGGPPGIIEFKVRLGCRCRSYVDMQVTHPYYRPMFNLWEHRKRRVSLATNPPPKQDVQRTRLGLPVGR